MTLYICHRPNRKPISDCVKKKLVSIERWRPTALLYDRPPSHGFYHLGLTLIQSSMTLWLLTDERIRTVAPPNLASCITDISPVSDASNVHIFLSSTN